MSRVRTVSFTFLNKGNSSVRNLSLSNASNSEGTDPWSGDGLGGSEAKKGVSSSMGGSGAKKGVSSSLLLKFDEVFLDSTILV